MAPEAAKENLPVKSGSFGEVTLDSVAGVATKRFKDVVHEDKMYAALREVAAVCALSHPHIVEMLSFEASADAVLMRMPLCLGSLSCVFGGKRPAAALGTAREHLVAALNHVHSCGFIHRDVNPRNVLVSGNLAEPSFLLADFNTCIPFVPGRDNTLCPTTFNYASPEMLSEAAYGKEADWWALGVTLLEAWHAGRLLFPGTTEKTVLLRVVAACPDLGALEERAAVKEARAQVLSPKPLALPAEMDEQSSELVSRLLRLEGPATAAAKRQRTEPPAWRRIELESAKCGWRDQQDLTWKMRGVLFGWLLDIAQAYDISVETVYVCFALIDAAVAASSRTEAHLRRSKLQLLGAACFAVACELTELHKMAAADIAWASDGAFCEEELAAEAARVVCLVDGRMYMRGDADYDDDVLHWIREGLKSQREPFGACAPPRAKRAAVGA